MFHVFYIMTKTRLSTYIHTLIRFINRISKDLIDKVIFAKIPDPEKDSKLDEIVKSNVVLDPCECFPRQSSCMKNIKCSKTFPKP